MKIPRKITVGATVYSVVMVPSLHKFRKGEVDYRGTIRIAKKARVANIVYSEDSQTNTFWHETVHAILEDMRSALEADEVFVSGFADRLHNAIKSAEFV